MMNNQPSLLSRVYQVSGWEERYFLVHPNSPSAEEFTRHCEEETDAFFREWDHDTPPRWVDPLSLVWKLCENHGYLELRAEKDCDFFAPDHGPGVRKEQDD